MESRYSTPRRITFDKYLGDEINELKKERVRKPRTIKANLQIKADLQIKEKLLEEVGKLNYTSYLMGTQAFNEDTSFLSLLYIAACVKAPHLKEKEGMSYSELLDDIFNTLNIACYIFVNRTFPGEGKAISLKIIGSEQELKKITDIATEVQAYATDERYEVGYFDSDYNQKEICKRDVNIGGFSPEYLEFDKRVSGTYNTAFADVSIDETISHVYRSASLKILLEAIPASSYGETMQLGISQFSSTSSNVDDQSHTLNKEMATSP